MRDPLASPTAVRNYFDAVLRKPGNAREPVALTFECDKITVHWVTAMAPAAAWDAACTMTGRVITIDRQAHIVRAVAWGSPPPGPWAINQWLPGRIPQMP